MITLNLDYSAMALLSCKRRFQLRVLQGLTSPKGRDALMGDVFHKVLEYTSLGASLDDSLTRATEGVVVDKLKLLSTMTMFMATRKLPPPLILPNGKPAVELKFSYHYKDYDTSNWTPQPAQDDPNDAATKYILRINLQGTLDRIHIDPIDGLLTFTDYKTSPVFSEGQQDNKIQDYKLTFQLLFYIYCMYHSGMLAPEHKILVEQGKYKAQILLLFYNAMPPAFRTVVLGTYQDETLFKCVPEIIDNAIQQIIPLLSLDKAPYDGMLTYKACSICDFRPACLSMNTADEQKILGYFPSHTYSPMNHR